MKKYALMSLVALCAIVLASCPSPMGGGRGGGSGVPTGSAQLPADQVSDQMRLLSGDFTFETLFPVALDLTIDLYAVDEAGMLVEPPFAPGDRSVVVTLTTANDHPVYRGMAAADGTLRAAVYLPSAPADMFLTVTAEGFESRRIRVPRMVELERVQRRLGLKQATGAIGAAAFAPGLPDRDGDGVPDVYDAFPDDPNSAFVLNVPADGNLTIAFEDLFGRANAGDADYNDFIANYRIQEISNADGHITSLRVDATAVVKLAGYNHRFGIRIDDFEGSASLVRHYVDESGATRSQGPTSVTAPVEVELFEHSGRAVGKSAWFTLEFATAQDRADSPAPLSEPPYNPWIFVRNTEQGIHLIDREPLTERYPSSNPNERFVDSDGFPWALLVPEEWVHPAEGQRIDAPQWYPRFTNWRESGGTAFTDWY
ncbi:MAG: LruC domain-containing protein, partial [Spirochaetaceae bacterium]